MASYYDSNKATLANAKEFCLENMGEQHFPTEGLYLGKLSGGAMELPALFDLDEGKGLCFLYDSNQNRERVNHCLERIAWRVALTVPSHLCDMILYNGGTPGDNFVSHAHINKYVVDERSERVFFDGTQDTFSQLLTEIYNSIPERIAGIKSVGKQNLYSLNASLGKDARMKYRFIFLADFPRHLKPADMQKLAQIAEAGPTAGIYLLMSWDMTAELAEKDADFTPQTILQNMQLLFPHDDKYLFKNTGHDDVLNRFGFILDDEPINPLEAAKWAERLDELVETAKKNARPSASKQDFLGIEKAPYEPVMSELSVTVGLDVNDKHPVTLRFNSRDYIHGFILGQSGSGKSVLLNNIICSLMLKYSPQDLMLYLMDFKGVEFNRYKGAKHTKAVLVDNSDAQMTLEVLRELRDENKMRVKLWQKESVNNIDGYNRKFPEKRLPQILFVADECQVMFRTPTKGTDRLIQQEISEILNIIATQGRSQGIHMLLATQQLDETDISGQILKNLTECFLLMSAPSDAEKLVPDSGNITSRQVTGLACYYHKKALQSQVKTFFAPDEELAAVIEASQRKAAQVPGNGQHYFCGSSMFQLADYKTEVTESTHDCPVAAVGLNIGINAHATLLPLRDDFSENILVFGANKQEQAAGVALNALASLMLSYNRRNTYCQFVVIDCLSLQQGRYKAILSEWVSKGLCRVVPRVESGKLLHELVEDLQNGLASPTCLVILGAEKFVEMKRKMPLLGKNDAPAETEVEEGIEMLGFSDLTELGGDGLSDTSLEGMTFPKALLYILDEGPLHGVHTLIQVDKPQNILFDDFDMAAAEKCRHRVMLKSENKFLQPFRLSQDIDVEVLSDEEEHLRAYYYPEGEDPVLFTPFQMPDKHTLETE